MNGTEILHLIRHDLYHVAARSIERFDKLRDAMTVVRIAARALLPAILIIGLVRRMHRTFGLRSWAQ